MKFSYKAIKDGKMLTGSTQAPDADKLAQSLRAAGVTIVSIEPSRSFLPSLSHAVNRVTFSNLVDFTRQLAIMLNAGLSIADSLDILKKQTTSPVVTAMLTRIDEEVRSGASLSTSLKNYPDIFSRLYIALVRAGEASGKLDDIMKRLAETLEKQREFQSKTKSALIYPAIVVVAMLAVIFIMITFVIPQLLTLYEGFNIQLPITTRILIFISSFMQKFWIIILAIVFGMVAFLQRAMKTKKGHRAIDAFFLRLPLISRVIKISALVNATRTLSVLVQAGVPILQALEIITETTDNVLYQEAFADIRQKVEKGATLGTAFEQTQIFPPIFVQMITVGEKTGHLDETLGHLAAYFESEAELAIKAVTVLIEPAILVVLGFGVGFVVISVITPIFSLTQAF